MVSAVALLCHAKGAPECHCIGYRIKSVTVHRAFNRDISYSLKCGDCGSYINNKEPK